MDYNDIYKTTMENSLQTRRKRINGECYVSKNKERKQKIEDVKYTLLALCSVVLVFGIGSGIGIKSTVDDEIRVEVHSAYEQQNPIDGKREYVNKYDENFIDYTDNLNDLELYKLYVKTTGDIHSYDMDRVVYEMEKNYLEKEGRGK